MYSLATTTNELPDLTDSSLFNDFIVEIHEQDWRQTEYLPAGLLPAIQEEMAAIEEILFPEDESEISSGFDKIHIRRLGRYNLSILFQDFCDDINLLEKGALTLTGYTGFVKDSFALRSADYTYYGTMADGVIKELYVQKFEQADDEFAHIASKYQLLLVDWCHGSITGM
jgi:hypothetical protein